MIPNYTSKIIQFPRPRDTASNVGDFGGGGSLDLADGLVLVHTVLSEDIAVFLIGLLHLPEERTGGREKGVDGLEGSVSGLGVD